eukprot:c4542_g1_i2.p1 GENE.c4542_g1_i2~~c4542_g1_i2.p1  ORF type:complete len:258 (-),score=56.73 c4542_g1_i2:161-934(-)
MLTQPVFLFCLLETNLTQPQERTGDFIARCQTFEGGLGGDVGHEAHGGYTFCGVAALAILNEFQKLNFHALMRWGANRQMSLEGGFQGRTNKLVDGCYSWWQGGLFPLLHLATKNHTSQKPLDLADQWAQTWVDSEPQIQTPKPSTQQQQQQNWNQHWDYDVLGLQQYLLLACQGDSAGMRDKPGKSADFYHTCYCLSGLSSSQYQPRMPTTETSQSLCFVLGPSANLLAPTHPVYNVCAAPALETKRHFSNLPSIL